MRAHPLRIGLLAHTQLQQRSLRILVEDSGHQAVMCPLIAELADQADLERVSRAREVDAWLVVVDGDSPSDGGRDSADKSALSRASDGKESAQNAVAGEQNLLHWLEHEHWLDQQSAAVIFCDGPVPGTHDPKYQAWARRLREKLHHLTGAINLANTEQGSAKDVWVLAASTGGPAAVKQFLGALPPGLGVGFVYVQHIDTGFKDTLAQVVTRAGNYPAQVVEHGSVIRPNEVAIVSPDNATELLANGTFVVNDRPWAAPYSPSADYVIANVAHCFGRRSGVIVFTGMGDDGAVGSRLMRQKGGQVWVQSPSTCTSDSMPNSTLAMGCVEFEGDPVELAGQLLRELKRAGNAAALPS
ncbi:chemotaxis protein CheB [Proteobacteria bacterium 005FR1]|nr:chemotaxis protein CheB [Proteobacteria bacterium 005FR1]